jgi:DNA-binding IclR family transcriptional regulator
MIRRQGLMRYNDNTIGSMRKLRIACDEVQQMGYAVDDEEEEIGVRCIAAPVRNSRGAVVAAISISGAKSQIEDITIKAARVKETAQALSHYLSPIVNEQQMVSIE